MDSRDFSIHLPMAGSVRMDLSGSVPSSQVISLAEGLGIQDVVVGKVSCMRDRNSKQVWLDANLRVIRIGQGKSEFELHKAQSMEDLSNQQGVLELARGDRTSIEQSAWRPAGRTRAGRFRSRAGRFFGTDGKCRPAHRSICLPPSFPTGANSNVFCGSSGKTCR